MSVKKVGLFSLLYLVCGITLATPKVDLTKYLPQEETVSAGIMSVGDQETVQKQVIENLNIINLTQQVNVFDPMAIPESQPLMEQGKLKLSFMKLEDGKIRLLTEPASVLDQIVLDPEKGEVVIKGRILSMYNEISLGQIPVIGKWEGIRWSDQIVEMTKGCLFSVSFSIGKITNEEGQKNTLHYQSLDMQQRTLAQENMLIFY